MKKIHLIGLTLFAVFAFGAIAASSAFAESQWLVDGKTIVGGESFATETTGLLLLVNEVPLFGKIEVDCEGVLVGTVGPAGKDEITKVTTPGGVTIPSSHALGTDDTGYLVEGTGLDCLMEKSNSLCGSLEALVEVWPDNLPWSTQVELVEEAYLDHLFGGGEGDEPGYDVLCNSTGQENLCEGLSSALLENMPEEGDVLGIFKLKQNGPALKCEIGTGDAEALEGLIVAPGHTLAVSDV